MPLQKQYLPDYKINLINLNEIADPEIFDGCLKHICQLVKFRNDAKKMKRYFDEHKNDFKLYTSQAPKKRTLTDISFAEIEEAIRIRKENEENGIEDTNEEIRFY